MQPCAQVSIVVAGAIPPLVKLLETGPDSIKVQAAEALGRLAAVDDKVLACSNGCPSVHTRYK